MAGGKKGAAGEGSKKAQGQARKAEAAAQKAAAEEARKAAEEAAEWQKGAKGGGKKEAEAAKKAEAARKKAEREALLAEEEKSTPGRAAPKNAKAAGKKTAGAAAPAKPARGLDLGQLDDDGGSSSGGAAAADRKLATVSASGIDNALDALSLDSGGPGSSGGAGGGGIDRHPERRFKAAYAAFEERRLAEMDADGTSKGLRLNQRKDKIRKEFEKSPDNPFNQLAARYDATKAELAELRQQEKAKIEQRLASP